MFYALFILALIVPLRAHATEEQFAPEELQALYFADLGSATVNVENYPASARRNYAVFTRACSQCHTLARAINSPRISRDAWDYYVSTMRSRSRFTSNTQLTKGDAEAVLDFLEYDSYIRKVKRQKEFEDLTRDLQIRFRKTIEERMRRLQKGAKVPAPN